MRRHGRLLLTALVGVLVVGSAVVSAADRFAITSVSSDDDGTVTLEFTVPGDLLAGRDPDEAITITENGATIREVTYERVPTDGLEIVLLLDTSGSMNENGAIDAAKQAAIGFVRSLPLDVAIGVVSFADTPSLVAPLGFDRNNLATAIGRLSAGGETSLYDAMVFSRLLFSGGTNDRQIVVLSDGGDTTSVNSLDAAIGIATDIRTSVVQLASSEADSEVLEQLVAARGGRLVVADDPSALESLYGTVAAELTGRFRAIFRSSATGSVEYELSTTDEDDEEVSTAFTATFGDGRPVEPGTPTTTTPVTTPRPSLDQFVTSFDGGAAAGTLWALGFGTIFGSFVILLVMTSTPVRRRSQELRARQSSGVRGERVGLVKRLTGSAERAVERSGRERALAANLDIAGLPFRPGEFVVLVGVGGLVLLLLMATILPAVLAFLFAVLLTPLAARAFVQGRIRDRRATFVEQLPDLLQTMVSSLRAGYGLPQALDVASNQSPDPTKTELQRVMFEVRIGRDPGDALSALATRMASPDFAWVVSAMQINREVGGELAVVLENVAETVRERQRLRRQIKVLTAEGRVSAYVLTALPFLLAFALLLSDRDYFDPFSEPPGPLLVILAIGMISIGWVWIRRLIKAEA